MFKNCRSLCLARLIFANKSAAVPYKGIKKRSQNSLITKVKITNWQIVIFFSAQNIKYEQGTYIWLRNSSRFSGYKYSLAQESEMKTIAAVTEKITLALVANGYVNK